MNDIFTVEYLKQFPNLLSKIPKNTGYCYFPNDTHIPTPVQCHYSDVMSGVPCINSSISGTKYCGIKLHQNPQYGANIRSYPLVIVVNKNGNYGCNELIKCEIDTNFKFITFKSGEKIFIDDYFDKESIVRIIPGNYKSIPLIAIVKTDLQSNIEDVEFIAGKIMRHHRVEGFYIARLQIHTLLHDDEYLDDIQNYCNDLKFNSTSGNFVSNVTNVETFVEKKEFLKVLSSLKNLVDLKLITYESLINYGPSFQLPPPNPKIGTKYHIMWEKSMLSFTIPSTISSTTTTRSVVPSTIPPTPSTTDLQTVVPSTIPSTTTTPTTPTTITTPTTPTQSLYRTKNIIPIESSTVALFTEIPSTLSVYSVMRTNDSNKLFINNLNIVTDTSFRIALGSASFLDLNGNLVGFKPIITNDQFQTITKYLTIGLGVTVV